MLVRVKRQAHGRNTGDAVAGKDLLQLALGRLEADHQTLHAVVGAQGFGDSLHSARKIIRHRKDITGKTGRGIGTRLVLFALQTATHVLRFGLGIEDILLRRFEIAPQRGQRLAKAVFARVFPVIQELFGHTLQFGFGRIIARLVIIGHVVWLSIQAISLPSERAVKSTMGTTRA